MPVRDSSIETTLAIPIEIAVLGLLFDMDGVLVRSTSGDERCWTRWAEQHGLSEILDLRRTHGRRAIDTIREHLPNLTEEELAYHLAQLDSYAEEQQSDVTAYAGVIELLAAISPNRGQSSRLRLRR